jgi:hypothetical protein
MSEKSAISSLLFLVIYALLTQLVLYLCGRLGSQAERMARERRRPSVPEVGHTNIGTTHGALGHRQWRCFFWQWEEGG